MSFLEKPDLRRLFDYWRSLRRGRLMPSKNDIDPLDIGWALSRVFLMDYRPAEGFTYRLAGTEVSSVFGHSNLKGLNLRDVVKPERLALIESAWTRVAEDQSVVCMSGMVYHGVDRTSIGERLLLPLADEAGGPVTGLLGMTVANWVTGEVTEEMRAIDVKAIPVEEIP
ncbi:PAS domain-containing protein [Pelagibius sp. CAU 1746]|uniref:PAS domain-containing protein n=1 Tax=Pelagibius sp. CAU 1746 TaxID=3140370 RepID=UPI00325A9D78